MHNHGLGSWMARRRLKSPDKVALIHGEGDTVTFHYDPMICKLVAHGASRGAALDRLEAGLADFRVEGVVSNIPFLRSLIAHPRCSG